METRDEDRRLASSAESGAVAWIVFVCLVGVLLAVDVTFLQPPLSTNRMSFNTAIKLTAFWLVSGLGFNFFILGYLGWEQCLGFLQGFCLEYILSFDNLFVFHLVFGYYCTPEALLYRALYFGIAGAIVLRVFFLVVGWALLQSGLYIFKLMLGAILIWSGIRSANDLDDEDTADPTNNRCIAWVTRNLPVSDNYEPHGHFFITEVESRAPRASSTDWGEADMNGGTTEVGLRQESISEANAVGSLPRLESFEGSSLLDPNRTGSNSRLGQSPGRGQGLDWPRVRAAGSLDALEVTRKPKQQRRKASLLLLVVLAIWVVDLVFAVDSVASKSAVVTDLFLNCSSSAFAMLSLRSLYFVMESLTRTFQMLKYGVAAILVLIGLKMIFAYWIDVSNSVCFAVVVGICVASIASSYWMPRFRENCERCDLGSIAPIAEGDDEEDREFFDRRAQVEDQSPEPNFRAQELSGRERASSSAAGVLATVEAVPANTEGVRSSDPDSAAAAGL